MTSEEQREIIDRLSEANRIIWFERYLERVQEQRALSPKRFSEWLERTDHDQLLAEILLQLSQE